MPYTFFFKKVGGHFVCFLLYRGDIGIKRSKTTQSMVLMVPEELNEQCHDIVVPFLFC